MPFLKHQCQICNKPAEVEKEYNISDKTIYRLKCQHIISQDQMKAQHGPHSVVSLDHKKLMPFQVKGVEFVLKSNARALIADEMGLGKTVQALGTLVCNPELLPAVIIVKSAIKTQWQREVMRWLGDNKFAQSIDESGYFLLPGLPAYIFSYDIIPRIMSTPAKAEKFLNDLKAIGVKTLIMDECQQIKNVEAKRTQSIRKLSTIFEHIIALSGTPIKNNAAEYFSVLNILKPEMFPSYSRFISGWCDSYSNGYGYKVGGLRSPKAFQDKTNSFIIRRERTEVLPDLPVITRNFLFENLSKEVEKAYAQTLKAFQHDMDGSFASSLEKAACVLSYINKMRHITGISKINPCVDFLEEFLISNDRKIVIFVHHKDVSELILNKINASPIMQDLNQRATAFTSDLNDQQRSNVIDDFLNSTQRVLIASTLAAGEGLNLQKCADCIVLERQWNPANEEQAEGRFIRIGQMSDKVTATYLVAIGTIDEYFAEIVEKKREIVASTLGGQAIKWVESDIMNELKDRLMSEDLRKWTL
jgi:SWI/SNF-related matrix-associated actin-dependent regulator of chromatin subfamily A-like protein 1